MRHTPIRVAMAMPLTGFDEEPSSPVMRDETTEKKKPNTMMATAERTRHAEAGHGLELGQERHEHGQGHRAAEHDRDRDVALRAALRPAPPAPVSRRSRKEARKLSMIVGIAFTRLMMPPAATAPAPM